MKKKLLVAALSSAIICIGAHVSALSNFFADVPADDWSYSAVNELISTGKVPGYTEKIPDGRIMSRLEMAMIVDEAQRNLSAFNSEEQSMIKRLGKEYFYDVKKVQLLNKLDAADTGALERNEDFTSEEKSKLKDLADRFRFDGYVRFRNDHYIKHDKSTNVKTRTTRANMVHLQIDSTSIDGKALHC